MRMLLAGAWHDAGAGTVIGTCGGLPDRLSPWALVQTIPASIRRATPPGQRAAGGLPAGSAAEHAMWKLFRGTPYDGAGRFHLLWRCSGCWIPHGHVGGAAHRLHQHRRLHGRNGARRHRLHRPGQTEGAMAIGMNHWQTMLHVILPQALRNIMPQIGNNLIINIKDTWCCPSSAWWNCSLMPRAWRALVRLF